MKFKRIIALNLVLIIVMSSMGFYSIGFSPDFPSYKDSKSSIATQLIADTQDPSHEFREGFKTNHTTQVNNFSFSFLYIASQCAFKVVRNAQHDSYLQKQLLQRPSSKLFIDFGALII